MIVKTLIQGPLKTNTYILINNGECIIIDPELNSSRISKIIEELNATPKAILLTHGHFDHIGAVNVLHNLYDIPIYASKNEEELLKNPSLNLSSMVKGRYVIETNHKLDNNQEISLIGLSIKCIATPGHTQGSMCYLVDSSLFAGDTLFEESYGRYDLPTGNLDELKVSIKTLLELDSNIIVYPGHGNATTIKHEQLNNPLR